MDSWLILTGSIASFLGFVNLENARRGLVLRPLAIFWALVAGYIWYQNFGNISLSTDLYSLIGLGLLFCGVSPLLGWLWWGQHGEVRKKLGRLLLFLVLSAVAFVFWSALLFPGWRAVLLALLTGTIPSWRLGKRFRRIRSRWRGWRSQRQADHLLKQEEALVKRQSRDVDGLLQREQSLSKKLRAKDQKISRLQAGEERKAKKLEVLRAEILEQVRLIRSDEVARIQAGNTGLSFHPHYGFLMAEGWRTLRAEIARGERTPPVETDEFLFQDVNELVSVDDFEERYLHKQGRQAIEAVNRYLDGSAPLSEARRVLKKLKLTQRLLAPATLAEYSGAELLEAWLVPHRRYQMRVWEDLTEGARPFPETLLRFLREQKIALPDRETWIRLWDEHPHVFAGVREIAV